MGLAKILVSSKDRISGVSARAYAQNVNKKMKNTNKEFLLNMEIFTLNFNKITVSACKPNI
jgi:hypothetical protein